VVIQLIGIVWVYILSGAMQMCFEYFWRLAENLKTAGTASLSFSVIDGFSITSSVM